VCSSITYNHPRCSKPRKYNLFQHPLWVSWVSLLAWHGFYLLGYIVNCHQNVLIIPWFQKWSHVINSPNNKELYLKIVGEWHSISSNDISVPLTWPTSLDKIFGVFIYGWPEETSLPNFCMSTEDPIMTSIWWWMIFLYDLQALLHWYTSSQQPIWAYPKEIRWIPHVETTFINKLLLVFS